MDWLPIAIVFIVAVLGFVFTSIGMGGYQKLNKPCYAPPGGLIGVIWIIIYIFIAWAWMQLRAVPDPQFVTTINWLFGINLLANLAWSFVFFTAGDVPGAMWLLAVLLLTTAQICVLAVQANQTVPAYLLAIYLLWLTNATWLNFKITQIN